MLSALRRLAAAPITADQFAGLDTLRQELGRAAASGTRWTLADREDALSDWLAGHGVDAGVDAGPALAAAGADVDWCERAAEALGEARLEPGWSGWRAPCRRDRAAR